jgi:hypothetical protein
MAPRYCRYVPGRRTLVDGGLINWTAALNAWAAQEIGQYKATKGLYHPNGTRAAESLLTYFVPLPPSHPMAGRTVVYNEGFVKHGKYVNPEQGVTDACTAAGVSRICVGHLPRGTCPAVIRNPERSLVVVMSDTSYVSFVFFSLVPSITQVGNIQSLT